MTIQNLSQPNHSPQQTSDNPENSLTHNLQKQDTIQDKINTLVSRFQFFNDWKDRYQYLIDMGKRLPAFNPEWQTDDNLIHGCQSQVWLHIEITDHRFRLFAQSDAAIVSGLIAILVTIYQDTTAEEILNTPLDFLGKIGLLQHLSPSRSNGLYNMIKHLHLVATHASSQQMASSTTDASQRIAVA